MKNFVVCLCCGSKTIVERGMFEICPVCFWEDDVYIDFEQPIDYKDGVPIFDCKYDESEIMDLPSGANNGLTLREGRQNYLEFGACEKSMLQYVDKSKDVNCQTRFGSLKARCNLGKWFVRIGKRKH